MHIFPFQALYPDVQQLHQTPTLFDKTKERYSDFLQAGLFCETSTEAIYLYEIQTVKRRHQGMLACVDITDYLNGNIKKHENTLPPEEYKQMQLTLERQAAVKPVLLAYSNAAEVDHWIENYCLQHPPFFEINFADEQRKHRLWAIDQQPEVRAFQQVFHKNISSAYIADGHHRMCGMARIAESAEDPLLKAAYRSVYCAFFPATELDILEFNRVVEVPENFNITQLEAVFEIKSLAVPAKPARPHELTLCTPQGWFQLTWKAHVLQEFATEPVLVDTRLLNEKVLETILGVVDIRHDPRIEYVNAQQGLEAIQRKVIESDHRIGFCLYPVTFGDLMELVEANQTLPPKSTWFEPRMKSGLLVKPY